MDDRFPQQVHSSTVASTFADEQQILKRAAAIDSGEDGGECECRDGSTRDTVLPAGVLPADVLPQTSILLNEQPVQVDRKAHV